MVDTNRVGRSGSPEIPQEHTVKGASHQTGAMGARKVSTELKGEMAKGAEKSAGTWESIKEGCKQLVHDLKMFLNKHMSKYPEYARNVQANKKAFAKAKAELSDFSSKTETLDKTLDYRKQTPAQIKALSNSLDHVITSFKGVKTLTKDPALKKELNHALAEAKELQTQLEGMIQEVIPDVDVEKMFADLEEGAKAADAEDTGVKGHLKAAGDVVHGATEGIGKAARGAYETVATPVRKHLEKRKEAQFEQKWSALEAKDKAAAEKKAKAYEAKLDDLRAENYAERETLQHRKDMHDPKVRADVADTVDAVETFAEKHVAKAKARARVDERTPKEELKAHLERVANEPVVEKRSHQAALRERIDDTFTDMLDKAEDQGLEYHLKSQQGYVEGFAKAVTFSTPHQQIRDLYMTKFDKVSNKDIAKTVEEGIKLVEKGLGQPLDKGITKDIALLRRLVSQLK